tara:strand:+ start:1090 stop:2394 length:1305 start_codon:yes stop_codon:yes gene_type:complete
MGFNLMAALGGAGRAMSQNIQEERLQMDKIELMDAEAATRERLARAAEKREQDKENERIAEGLSYYLTDEEVAVAMKRGIGSAKELLNKAQNFDGDFGAAFNLPEITNAPYGEDLLESQRFDEINKQAEVSRLTDPLSTFITEESKQDDQHTTWAAWEIDWFEEQAQIQSSKMSPKAKKDALAKHNEIWSEYLLKIGAIADAKREPDKQIDSPDYTDKQLMDSFEQSASGSYSAITGIAGQRSLQTEERGGGNSYSVANVLGGINMYNLNIVDNEHVSDQKKEWVETKFQQDRNNLSTAAINVYAEFRDKAIEYKNQIDAINNDASLSERKKKRQLEELSMGYGTKAFKPSGILTASEFVKRDKADELKVGGIYIVKGKDSANAPRIRVITYLGEKIPYDSEISAMTGKKYITHRETGIIDQDIFDFINNSLLN